MYKVSVKVNGQTVAEGYPETLGQARYMAKAFTNDSQTVEATKVVDLEPKTRQPKKTTKK